MKDAPNRGGALIVDVIPDSPAKAAGLQLNDIIVDIDGEQIDSRKDVEYAIRGKTPGEHVSFIVVREGVGRMEINATVAARRR